MDNQVNLKFLFDHFEINSIIYTATDYGITSSYSEVLNSKLIFPTKLVEFLFDCVEDTVVNIIPNEIKYLSNYDAFKRYLEEEFEMPDKLIATLVRFLEQNNGVISKRAREKEFSMLELKEIKVIEDEFKSIFM
jgi:hypothetical protein